jgi:23S rRNA (cytosine1962-C5)-methyltransferase
MLSSVWYKIASMKISKSEKLGLPVVRLKSGREKSIKRGHPWIFSGAIDVVDQVEPGSLVCVIAKSGEFLGVGHFGTGGIAVRIVSSKALTELSVDFWNDALAKALAKRTGLALPDSETDCFRLVHGEGDYLPGLVIDRYGDLCVIQCHSLGMYLCRERITEGIRALYGSKLRAVYDRSGTTLSESDRAVIRAKGQEICDSFLYGAATEIKVRENGLAYVIDWQTGQKTGFYLDQRCNRKLVRNLCQGKRVLNLFSYSGGFTVNALAGGAIHATSVDASADALALLDQNLALNGLDSQHRSYKGDCFEYLEQEQQKFDFIVVDPPAFIKHQKAKQAGMRGYEAINDLALRHLEEGGTLVTFSCSQLLSSAEFEQVVSRAVNRIGRRAAIQYRLHQAPCHPVNLFHAEGEYLKGLVLQLD